ncbi:MFS transporter [Dactylosporangium sp. CA-233914]|uniref:MFS transporter n=1 Tax=Dactylosporangium sp. CA-233914 TaxID=3239934 RepID=UPI003D941BA1
MTTQHLAAAVEIPRAGVTPLRRLVPAMLSSLLGFAIAMITPLQLLLTLRLSTIAGDDATTAFGIVTGFGALVALAFGPIAGRLSDRTRARLGRRRTWILTGSLLLSLTLVAIAAATEVWQVVVLWCVAQSVGNLQFVALSALVADQVPEHRRGGVSGLMGMIFAVGPLAGLVLTNRFPGGSHAQWWAIAAAGLALSLLAVALLRDPRNTGPKQPLNLRTIATTFWFNPRRYPALGWAWLVRFLITCAYASTTYNTFLLMQRFEVSAQEVGGLVLRMSLLMVGCLAVASAGAGYLSDAVRRQKPFVACAGALAAAGLVLTATASDFGQLYVASALLGLGTGTFFAVDLALCVRVLPDGSDAGKDLAIINLANSLPQSLVPFAAPVLLALGGFHALYLTLAVVGILGAVAVLRIPEVGREREPSRWTVPIIRVPAATLQPEAVKANTSPESSPIQG